MANVTINRYGAGELPARLLRRVNVILRGEFDVVDRRAYASQDSLCLIAHVDEHIAGVLLFAMFDSTDVYVDWLVTLPQFRNRGVASALLRDLMALFPASRLRLHVEATEGRLLAMYRHLGFVPTDVNDQIVTFPDGTITHLIELEHVRRCVVANQPGSARNELGS